MASLAVFATALIPKYAVVIAVTAVNALVSIGTTCSPFFPTFAMPQIPATTMARSLATTAVSPVTDRKASGS